MTYPDKSELYKKSLKCEFELLGNKANTLVVSSHPNIQSNLSDTDQSQNNIFLIKQISDYNSKIPLLDENDVDSLNIGKFQFIVLDDVLEYLINPRLFLTQISKFLENDGRIVCSVSNFTNTINRIKILDGDFNDMWLDFNEKIHFFSLDNLLLLLSEANFSITDLIRIKIDITKSNQTDLKNYIMPMELLDAIANDPESNAFTYVFSIKPGSSIDSSTRRWISEFSKNQVTEKIDSIFKDIRKTYEKKIDYYNQANREQYAMIKHLEQGISETTEHYEKIIEQVIKDKDAYTEQVIKDKDSQLQEIKQSTMYKLLRILDKLRGKNNA